ncbi:MAG: pseudouridine synthase [Ignavibacteriales bacterium]|nr:pseudouridine synthase [Ignavibacteriales bacterium]
MKKFYFALHKPYNVLCQFTDKAGRPVLKSLYNFPAEVYPVGRLDMDSEGLILLTNDKPLTDLLLNPKYRHEREYTVFVEGVPDEAALQKLRQGVIIEGKKTLPAKAEAIEKPAFVDFRVPPMHLKPSLTYSWISLTLTEGRNRQVRKMTANVGLPTVRLIRNRIENINIEGLACGSVRELRAKEVATLYKRLEL